MDEIIVDCNNKISSGNSLLSTLDSISNRNIGGLNKLKAKIKKEINFLVQTKEKGLIKKEHVVGSNLNHFEALVKYLLQTCDCTDVLKVFHFRPDETIPQTKRVDVDVVSENKRKWAKVIARNPKSLSLISKGEGGFGQKSIVDHAFDYLQCAQQNTHLYKAPYIEFYFGPGVEWELAAILLEKGITVSGDILGCPPPHHPPLPLAPSPLPYSVHKPGSDVVRRLNLDVTTMIGYVSGLTNGRERVKLKGKMLQEQAEMEMARPLKPVLDEAFKGKQLYACKSGVDSFMSLVEIMGGEGERRRARELLARVTIVPDCSPDHGGIGGRSEAVFQTGAALRSITLTANKSYVNSAAMKGIHYEVIIHEPRGLSESKEIIKGDGNEKESDS